jgi:hypothetical protein
VGHYWAGGVGLLAKVRSGWECPNRPDSSHKFGGNKYSGGDKWACVCGFGLLAYEWWVRIE